MNENNTLNELTKSSVSIAETKAIPGQIQIRSIADVAMTARLLVETGMTPAFKGTKEAAIYSTMGAIIAGCRVGLDPFQAAQSVAVINGRPCLWGDAMMAVVQASGTLEDIKTEFIPKASAATACRVIAKRKGIETPFEGVFTLEMAHKARLPERGTTWATYTADMLYARARSRCLRRGWADILGGLYSADEAHDGETTARLMQQNPTPAPTMATVTESMNAATPKARRNKKTAAQEPVEITKEVEVSTPTPQPIVEQLNTVLHHIEEQTQEQELVTEGTKDADDTSDLEQTLSMNF